MREIKFRVWDIVSKKFLKKVPISNITIGHFSVNGFIFQQFTGLKDKNGKEMFSDDIVTDGLNPPFAVDLWNFPLMVRLSEIEFEIIGNIYQNKDLLV